MQAPPGPPVFEVELVDDDEYAFIERAAADAEQLSATQWRPARIVPPSLLAAPAPSARLPSLSYPGAVRYVHTPFDVDAAARQLLVEGPKTVGFDIEWKVLYQLDTAPRPVALMQFCWRTGAAGSPRYACLLAHLARSGLTPHLRGLLESEALVKAGVGAHGDALKVARDFGGLAMRGVLDLSDFANARLCGSGAEGGAAAQRWSLARLAERLLQRAVAKPNALRCGDWEAPLTAEQIAYASTDAFASLRLYETLNEMPVTWQPPALDLARALPAEGGAALPDDVVPAWSSVGALQPAKLAVFELHARGWTLAQIAAHRRIQEDTAQAYVAEGITAGYGYSLAALRMPGAVLEAVAEVAGRLLGRRLGCAAPDRPGEPVDMLAALLGPAGREGIRQLKEGSFPAELGYGQLRLALAHLGRCNPGPWPVGGGDDVEMS